MRQLIIRAGTDNSFSGEPTPRYKLDIRGPAIEAVFP
jgi:hypothetical protein